MEQAITVLKDRISGNVVLSGDAQYEKLRQVPFNHTALPLAIVQVMSAEDVSAAIDVARRNHLTLSVRSGGHSGAGLSTNDDGIVIDLSLLNQVEVIDADKRLVRIGAGATWAEVATNLEGHKWAISSGDTGNVGVGGLSLGGGIGWMVREHGLTIDALEAVEIVTAKGELVRATAGQNSDLFWAVRGGGGNFGVATAFEFRAVPCDGVIGGKLIFDAADRQTVLSKWAAYMRSAPEKLTSIIMLLPGFGPDAKSQLIMAVCYAATDEAAAQKALQPLRDLAPIIRDDVRRMSYAEMLEEAKDTGAFKVRVRNGFVRKITPELIDTLANSFGKPGAPMLQIRSLGDAMSHIASDATAFEHRGNEALIVMNAKLPQDRTDEQADHLADSLWAPVRPFVHGAYIGLHTDNSERSTDEAYQTNRNRLEHIKATYDPENLFNQNTNIKPA